MKKKGGKRRHGFSQQQQSNGAARGARFAAVIEMMRRFWARLRGIGQMPGCFLIGQLRVSFEAVELPPAVEVAEFQAAVEDAALPAAVEGAALPPAEHAENQLEELIVGGLPVTEDEKLHYKEYCRARAGYPEKVTFCHLCFFHKVKYDGGKFPASKRFLHYAKHEGEGDHIFCPRKNCLVRVSSLRDKELHIHFCHNMAAGWWAN